MFHAGAYYVQEPSSMMIGSVAKAALKEMPEGAMILDLCAAPGGKSTDLASVKRSGDTLVSNEVIGSRVRVLKENVIKWGGSRHLISNNDPADFDRLEGMFDLMVVDAPCSGEGLFRKDANAVNEWSPKAVEFCQQRQIRILEDAWSALKAGGVLIYSTCTMNEKENEEVLSQIINHYEVEPFQLPMRPEWSVWLTKVGDFTVHRMLPHRTHGEGFSFFVLRKLEGESEFNWPRRKKKKGKSRPTSSIDLDEKFDVADGQWFMDEDRVVFFPDSELLEVLIARLRLVRKGTLLGTLKRDKVIPSHELAMATDRSLEGWPRYELDYEESIRYLQKIDITIDGGSRGFGLVTYRGVPLGWVNHLGNRVNNLYPSEFRILSQQATYREEGIL